MADITLAAAMYACQILIFLVCTTAVTSSDVHYQMSLSSVPVSRRSVADFSDVNVVAYDPSRYRRQAASSPVTSSTSDVTENNGTSTGQVSPLDANASAAATTTSNVTSTESPVDSDNNTTLPFQGAEVTHDNHQYYTSDLINNDFDKFWVELATATQHKTLSTAHRVAGVLPLKFKFYFYGHEVTNITVATGGFIYMSPFLHQWLTATQYIAPLMANFDPSLSKNSNIYYESLDDKFIVEWKDVILKDQQDSGKFHFQTILHRDNSITFVYKTVPIPISNISREFHPVKVGVSDAYYNDTYIPKYNIKRRTIYEYHKLSVDTSLVYSGSVVRLKPLPTCNLLTTCDSCTTHTNVKFECKWCNKIARCSDGLDWYRQHWDNLGCKTNNNSDSVQCEIMITSEKPATPTATSTERISQRPESTSTPTINVQSSPHTKQPIILSTSTTQMAPDGSANDTQAVQSPECDVDGECDDDEKSDFPVAVVVVVILLVCAFLGIVGGWVFYAYTHPTSKSGMWLMEHRPSQIKAKIKFWKSSTASGAKYQTETDA